VNESPSRRSMKARPEEQGRQDHHQVQELEAAPGRVLRQEREAGEERDPEPARLRPEASGRRR
jgi:hypothetical protein